MNANTTLQKIRDLARSRMLELQPMNGEEMSLPLTDPHYDGFVAGERALAAQILALLDDKETVADEETAGEAEMVLSLGQT